MRNGSNELTNIAQLARKLPAARAILREARIDSSDRIDLRTAALAAGTTPDELLAQIEARLRRQARRASQPHPEELELEYA